MVTHSAAILFVAHSLPAALLYKVYISKQFILLAEACVVGYV